MSVLVGRHRGALLRAVFAPRARRAGAVIATLGALLAACGGEDGAHIDTLMVGGAWARSTAPGASTAAVYRRTVVFEPGGRHLMLTGLVAPLRSGSSFRLTLHFAQHEAMPVDIAVRDEAPER